MCVYSHSGIQLSRCWRPIFSDEISTRAVRAANRGRQSSLSVPFTVSQSRAFFILDADKASNRQKRGMHKGEKKSSLLLGKSGPRMR